MVFSMSGKDFSNAKQKIKMREDKVALKEADGGAQMWLTMRVKRGDANAQHATGLFPFLPQRSLACQHRTCQHHTLGMSLHATRTHLREPLCVLQQVLAIGRWRRKYLKRDVRVSVEIEVEGQTRPRYSCLPSILTVRCGLPMKKSSRNSMRFTSQELLQSRQVTFSLFPYERVCVSTENMCSCTPLHIKSTPSLGLTVITHFYFMFARAGRICDRRYVVNWFKNMRRRLPKGGGIKRPREDAVQVHLSVADYTKTPTAHTRSTHTQK